MKGAINKASKSFEAAENCNNYEDKGLLYLNAAKIYLETAEAVTENSLKISLIFLSNVSSHKANNCAKLVNTAQAARINNIPKKYLSPQVANTFLSNRIVYEPHLMRLQELNEVLHHFIILILCNMCLIIFT